MSGRLYIKWFTYALLAAGAAAVAGVIAGRIDSRQLLQRRNNSELDRAWTEVKGLRMHARQAVSVRNAQKIPLVCVHGWGVSGAYFMPSAERLASEFNIYAPDLPGHGLSDSPAHPLDVAGLAEMLVAWMNCVGIPRAVLIGQSMGCQIAVEAAFRHPERIDRMILIGPTLDPILRHSPRSVPRLMLGALYERPSLICHLVKDYLRMGWRLLPEYLAMNRDLIEEKLPKIQTPTMLVRGENDTVVSRPWFDEVAARLRAHRSFIIPDWGHAVQYSAPQQLVDAIRPFLEERFT